MHRRRASCGSVTRSTTPGDLGGVASSCKTVGPAQGAMGCRSTDAPPGSGRASSTPSPAARRSRRSPTTASCPTARSTALVAPSGNVEWLCLPRIGLAERVRRDPRPRRRRLPLRARRRHGAGRPPLPARARWSLETSWGTPTGWVIVRDVLLIGPVAPRRRALATPPARADRLRRRARPAAHGPLRERRGAGDARLRAGLRLRPAPRRWEYTGERLPRGQSAGRRRGRPRA